MVCLIFLLIPPVFGWAFSVRDGSTESGRGDEGSARTAWGPHEGGAVVNVHSINFLERGLLLDWIPFWKFCSLILKILLLSRKWRGKVVFNLKNNN